VYVLSIAYQPNGAAPISSTTKRVHGKLVLPNGIDMAEYSTPRAIETKEIPGIVEDFRVSARNCIEAGALKNIQPHLLLVHNDHCVAENTQTCPSLSLSLSLCASLGFVKDSRFIMMTALDVGCVIFKSVVVEIFSAIS
jgi:hypothetical protein